VAKPKDKPAARVATYDPRCVSLFPNTHQAQSFREAVQTSGAKKVIPINQQFALAKEIMSHNSSRKMGPSSTYIKQVVHARVEQGLKQQRTIDKAERDIYLAEQIGEEIDAILYTANGNLRGLISSLLKLEKLAEKYPSHPKLGGFSARLDDLVDSIKQFSRKLK